jgi:hypothetical protein
LKITDMEKYLIDTYRTNGSKSPIVAKGVKRGHLIKIFNQAGYNKGAEIGVAYGKFSAHMCKYIPGIELICVDPWETYLKNPRATNQASHDSNYDRTKKSLEGHNAKLLKMMSLPASRMVKDEYLDFIYIDGNHTFDYVMTDIIEWSKKVRPGGIVSGHDYYPFRRAQVVPAVDAYVKAHKIRDWFLTDEKTPSFFWVK